MRQQTTDAIVLRRTNYGEADRIISLLTHDFGKIRVIAKGVRRSKSKLAGGIELFSESAITFIKGRGEIDTLVSTRLTKNYGNIVKDLERTSVAYAMLKAIDTSTEDDCEANYYELLSAGLRNLSEVDDGGDRTMSWFLIQLLMLTGHAPELKQDADGEPLAAEAIYEFDFSGGRFQRAVSGMYTAEHIKLMRLIEKYEPVGLGSLIGIEKALPETRQLLQRMAEFHLRIKPV